MLWRTMLVMALMMRYRAWRMVDALGYIRRANPSGTPRLR